VFNFIQLLSFYLGWLELVFVLKLNLNLGLFFCLFFFDSVHSSFNLMALASWDSMAAPPHRFPLSATSTVSVSRSSPDVLQELCTENSPEVFSHDWCSIPSNFIGKFTNL